MADQKLNIIFTGDVSQLDKAINEGLKDLTNFENKLKGISGLDLSGLSSEIDSIRSKFSKLDIKVDSQKALSELNKISGQLSGVKDVLIDVDVNDQEAKSQIDSIVQRIKSIDLGTLSFPDIQGATSEINQILADLSKLKDTDVLLKVNNAPALAAINQVEANLKDVRSSIVLQVDSTKVNQDIQDIKTKFAAFGEIDIKADPSGALAAIDKILADINSVKSQEVILQADNSEALSSINDVQSRLQGIKSNILVSVDIGQSVEEIRAKFLALGEIDIEADPSQALNAVDLVLADIAKIKTNEVLLKADNSQALAAINQIEGRAKDIKAKITVDTSAALSEVNSLLTKISGLKGKDISININGTQVIRTVDQIEKELLQLQAALKKATDPRDVAKLTQQFSVLSRSISGINANQFSNLARGSQTATFALTNLGRVAQDLPFGFLGIANNLNPLLESFQRLKAESGSTSTALKALGSSLAGAGGIGLGLSVVSSLLITFGDKLFSSSKSADSLSVSLGVLATDLDKIKEAVRDLDIEIDFKSNIGGLLAEINLGSNSLKVGLNKLQTENVLNFEKIFDIDAAIDQTDKLSKRVFKTFQDNISEAGRRVTGGFTFFKDIPDDILADLSSTDQKLINAVKNADKALDDLGKQRVAAQRQGVVFLNQIRLQEQLIEEDRVKKAKELRDKQLDDLKAFQDRVIAKARQFNKEFGNAFVVPDLEDSFFKTRGQIFKTALKELDDISKGNLKIKIPVLAELDVSVVPVINEDSIAVQSFDKSGVSRFIEISRKRLEESFFAGLQSELNIPVNVVIDPTLSVDNRKLIDEKLKLREQFGVLGDLGLKEFAKIDFTNINKGLQEASRTLTGMLEIANTLNQSIGQGLSNAFNLAFDAALEGKNVFKALGEGLKQLIIGTIKAIAQMLILRAVTSLIFPGLNTPLPLSIPGISRGRVGSAAPSFGGISGGGLAAPSLVATVRGTDLQFVLTQGANQINRVR
jgi:hypothetical protein